METAQYTVQYIQLVVVYFTCSHFLMSSPIALHIEEREYEATKTHRYSHIHHSSQFPLENINLYIFRVTFCLFHVL